MVVRPVSHLKECIEALKIIHCTKIKTQLDCQFIIAQRDFALLNQLVYVVYTFYSYSKLQNSNPTLHTSSTTALEQLSHLHNQEPVTQMSD